MKYFIKKKRGWGITPSHPHKSSVLNCLGSLPSADEYIVILNVISDCLVYLFLVMKCESTGSYIHQLIDQP